MDVVELLKAQLLNETPRFSAALKVWTHRLNRRGNGLKPVVFIILFFSLFIYPVVLLNPIGRVSITVKRTLGVRAVRYAAMEIAYRPTTMMIITMRL